MEDRNRKWAGYYGWFVVAAGAIFYTAALPALEAPATLFYRMVGHPSGEPLFVSAATRLSVSLLGAVTIGWGLTIVAAAEAAAGKSLIKGLTRAILIWFVIDSAASIVTGYPLNAVSNAGFVALFFAPMMLAAGKRAAA